MKTPLLRMVRGLKRRWIHRRSDVKIRRLAKQVANHAQPKSVAPVIVFNASTRLSGVSLNAAFSLLTAWSLRLGDAPVVHFVCSRGMSRCVLGTNREHPDRLPPCKECTRQSRALFAQAPVREFTYQPDPQLECMLDERSIDEMSDLEYQGVPLGRLVLPSLRWILRQHHLDDDTTTRDLFCQYILSAWSLVKETRLLLEECKPQSVVLFNGMFYPEATVRWVAQNSRSPVPVITHEVGLKPFSAFFTHGEATAYPIGIPESFRLNPEQNERLEKYISQRFQGDFSMAGIRFWPEMQPIPDHFWERARAYHQVVAIFTNVVFDTSQGHANVVFPDMFAWLDRVKTVIETHPDTYFVLRAHPDETRSGKESCESVAEWVRQNQVDQLPNVYFVDPDKYFSSYELVRNSKFVMVYNSTIGLEASLSGAPVLCAGKARYTQIPTVFFPGSVEEFMEKAHQFLKAETIQVPEVFAENARRFLYYQVFRTSLPFENFIEEDAVWKGYVQLRKLTWQDLLPERSETFSVINNGILHEGDFLLSL